MNGLKIATLLLTLASWGWPVAAQAHGEDLTKQFLQLELDLMIAVKEHDRAGMEALLSADYKLTSSDSSGALLSRQAYINGSMNPELLQAKAFEFLQIEAEVIDEDVVLVRSKFHWESQYRGKPWNANFLMSDIWRKENGNWRLVFRHSSYPADELPRIIAERYSQSPD